MPHWRVVVTRVIVQEGVDFFRADSEEHAHIEMTKRLKQGEVYLRELMRSMEITSIEMQGEYDD